MVNVMFPGSPSSMRSEPYVEILASSSLLGVIFGLLFNRYVILGAWSILVHSWRLTFLSWLATAVIAGVMIGHMTATGIG